MGNRGQRETEPVAVAVERDVAATMRDGVTLYADIYRPDVEGRFPVLVMRTPYGKAGSGLERTFFARSGYVVVIQDCRGRYASEGDFYPFFDDVADGYDTVEWASRLPWSNGDVGMIGQSYMALTQYLAAKGRPPSLKALCPISGPVTYPENCIYRGGALELGWTLNYFPWLAAESLRRKGQWEAGRAFLQEALAREDAPPLTLNSSSSDFLPSMQAYNRLPITSWAADLKDGAPYLADFLDHPRDDEFWAPVDLRADFDLIKLPMFHIGSWYDAFQYDTLAMYRGLREYGAPGQKLLMGPWGHLMPFSTPTTGGAGDIDFGPAAAVELLNHQLRWLDHVLKGKANGIERESNVRIFVMGRNEWRDESEWPLASTRYTDVFLASGGHANGAGGDGRLTFEPAGDQTADRFTYDPSDPTPTEGGACLGLAMGAFDQRSVEARLDVLVYTSVPLEAELEVTGPVLMVLFASSSAPDTDFTAKLVDVRPDGYAQNIADGVIRARYRNSRHTPEMMKPGNVYRFEIDLWSTSHVFMAGHRLRVEISSSNFPRYDRNPNTGEEPASAVHMVSANQTIFHDRERPSRLILPVIPNR